MRFISDFLFPPRESQLVVRDLDEKDFLAFLSPSPIAATQPSTITLLSLSRKPVGIVIQEAKDHGTKKALDLLGLVLATYLEAADLEPSKTLLLPVPLSPKRYQERGYNQAAKIAERAGEKCRIRVESKLLTRERETLSQVALARKEREINMLGAFAATRSVDSSLTYLILDDTITTGATLQAAIDALRSAGAKRILPIALAH